MQVKSDVFLYQGHEDSPTIMELAICSVVHIGDLTLYCAKGSGEALRDALMSAMGKAVANVA